MKSSRELLKQLLLEMPEAEFAEMIDEIRGMRPTNKDFPDFNYYRCPQCNWVTPLSSNSEVCECEFCNPIQRMNLKTIFDDATKTVMDRFFSKNGWQGIIIEGIHYRAGINNKFNFEIRILNEETNSVK